MAKDYGLKFGSGDPRNYSGLTPTFIQFWVHPTGTVLPPPGITEVVAGSGAYWYNYGTTQSIWFTADGGAALAATDRYVTGLMDPIQSVDQKIGNTTDSFGATNIDPSSILAFLKRNQEFQEGNSTFNKTTGAWDIYSRGSSTLLAEKALTNTSTQATKT